MTARRFFVGVVAAQLCMALPAQAWEQVGYQQADFKRDRDTIAVKGNDRHKRIRLCVEREPIRMRDLDVVFANGGNQDVQVRRRIAPGSCTRAIDLRGNRRNIARIEMFYDRRGDGRPAIIKVYAR